MGGIVNVCRRMFSSASRVLAKLSGPAVIASALIGLALVGIVDYLTGYQISFSVFYVVPIGVATWYSGLRAGLGFALGSSLVWYVAERVGGYQYHHPLILIWNALVWLSFFVMTTLLLFVLRERLSAERRMARTDALTGVLNSRAFVEQLEHDLALTGRAGSPLTLAYIDVHDFKVINDTYGHGEGDCVLRTIGRTLIEGTRRTDGIARLGGDEFALILPATDLNGAEYIISKLRKLLSESLVRGAPPVTCSFGVVEFREQPHGAEEAIAVADRLMYDAKTQGKNATVFRVYVRATDESIQPNAAADWPHAAHRSLRT
jgi:diguanylate cyclase (GGDEF)-like protein